jgi:hypothetical protein
MPDSTPDQRCCSWCPFFVAVLASGARPFVYGASGENLFPPVSDRAYLRGDEPPVPPPRVAAARCVGSPSPREGMELNSNKEI